MTVLKIIKIFLLVLYAVCESCEAYHRYGNIKSDQHKNSLWNNKLYNANSASSTSSSSWYRNNRQHGGTTTTTAIPHHIRHGGYSSRYPKLDGVMHRLNPSKKPKPTESPSFHGKKANDHRWDSYYEENDYDEDDVLETIDGKEEDIAEDDHKWNDDDTYDNDYSEDEDDYFDVDDTDEIQAEEATDAPTSSLTDYKWEHFGSRDRVEKSRNMQMQQLKNTVENPADAAVSHYLKVQAAGKCRVPIPKVLPVHSEHPSHGKTYIPHCTILHRCSEDSGCCQNQGTKCGPKSQTIVELYFYAHSRGTTHVEKLSFYNHTECACIDINELAALNNNAADVISTVSKKTISLKSALPAENLIRCKCPSQFIPNPRYTSYCSCTCSNDNIDCERMQRGMEYLSLKDRICIKSGQCSFPTCEYGKYIKDVGRCPKKLEKQEGHTNSNSN